jgi:hypothetical protein
MGMWYPQDYYMSKRKNKKERPVFDSIRKPSAPPTRMFKTDKDTLDRKVKHKKSLYSDNVEAFSLGG